MTGPILAAAAAASYGEKHVGEKHVGEKHVGEKPIGEKRDSENISAKNIHVFAYALSSIYDSSFAHYD